MTEMQGIINRNSYSINSYGSEIGCDYEVAFLHIYPTPPLGQDMTQGQFFKRSLTGLNSEFSFS